MPRRVIALLIAVGLSFGIAGCDGCGRGCAELAIITAPVWVPIVLIDKAAQQRKAQVEEHKTREAAEKGDPKALRAEAEKGDPKAAEKLRAEAEKGDPSAEYELGNQYWGRGTSEDSAEGVKWYRKSAEQGFGDAQVILGFAYQTGYGIEPDKLKADAWYIIAASNEKSPTQTIDLAVQRREIIEASMTPDQIAEAQKQAQEWKPVETGSKS